MAFSALSDFQQYESNESRQQRRNKTMVSDTEKDDAYWNKRTRNNIAARKSRENKRLLNDSFRYRVVELEEENALLKRELSELKLKFEIKDDNKVKRGNGKHIVSAIGVDSDADNMQYLSTPTPFAKVSLTTSRVSQQQQCLEGSIGVYGGTKSNATTSIGKQPAPGLYYKKHLDALHQHQDQLEPADLSVKSNKRSLDTDETVEEFRNNGEELSVTDVYKVGEQSSGGINGKRQKMSDDNEDDIKTQLQALSEQLQKMKKFVFNSAL